MLTMRISEFSVGSPIAKGSRSAAVLEVLRPGRTPTMKPRHSPATSHIRASGWKSIAIPAPMGAKSMIYHQIPVGRGTPRMRSKTT